MKILHLSDTHSQHRMLEYENVDMVIHSGDSTNYREWMNNQPEFEDFIDWYINYPVKHKILIAGNHDAWSLKKYNVDRVKEAGIIYLEHGYVEIEGITMFGSPWTPMFNNWHWMKDRSKMDKTWSVLEEGIDILITHGPPRGILDLSRNHDNVLEYCGDKSLLRHVLRIHPQYMLYGHIHNFMDCINQGTRIYEGITFMNASVVEDGKFGQLSSKGIIFNYEK